MNITFTNDKLMRMVLAVLILAVLAGCGARNIRTPEGGEPPTRPVSEYVTADNIYWIDEYDPWEGFNRPMYYFNAKFDKYVFMPVVNAYRFVTPDFLRRGLSNAFSNLGEIENFVNNVLQLKPVKALKTAGRFGVNTTMGWAGLFDPATTMGLYEYEEDFGQTLGRYGVGSGPYLVMPIFGPSSLRDTVGNVVDSAAYTAIIEQVQIVDTWRADTARQYGTAALKGVSRRDDISFQYYDTGSPFEYELVRKLFLTKRKLDLEK